MEWPEQMRLAKVSDDNTESNRTQQWELHTVTASNESNDVIDKLFYMTVKLAEFERRCGMVFKLPAA